MKRSMTDGTTDLIQEMNLQQALGNIRALSAGSTTFLRALKDVEHARGNSRAIRLIKRTKSTGCQTATPSRSFRVAVRLLREGMGDLFDLARCRGRCSKPRCSYQFLDS
jgi:hypothetical protein